MALGGSDTDDGSSRCAPRGGLSLEELRLTWEEARWLRAEALRGWVEAQRLVAGLPSGLSRRGGEMVAKRLR